MKTNNYNYAQNTVNEFNGHIKDAGHVFRNYDIETASSNHLSLREAAQSVSTPTDEVLAVMEYRMRHAAQNAR
jgi:iron-sulfur cluster repair protein YtfE (RIC family)